MSRRWAGELLARPAGARPLRVLIVTQYFPPEVGAPQTRLFELARRLVPRGHDVTVLAPWPHYPTGVVPAGVRRVPVAAEVMEGVRVVRTAVYATPNTGFAKRLADHLSFTAMASIVGPMLGQTDVLFVESPPIFHGLAGLLRRNAFVFNVADLWLESAIEMGILKSRALIKLTELFQRTIYRRAQTITVVTDGIAKTLREQGVPAERVRMLPNGVDAGFFRPLPEDGARLRAELGLGDGFLALYAGTLGLAHGLDVMLGAAEQLRSRPDVSFVLAGEGADKARLVALAQERGLANVRFLPNQPKERMPALLSAVDACVVPLRDLPIFRGARPSKMFEAMATARPVVLSVAGEAADLLAEAGGGVAVPPGRPSELAAAVAALADDRARGRELGEAGRAWVSEHLSRDAIAERFEAILYEAVERYDARTLQGERTR